MATHDRYAIPEGPADWAVPGTFNTNFRWEYQDGRDVAPPPLPEGEGPAVGRRRRASTGRRTSTPRTRSSSPTSPSRSIALGRASGG